VSCVLAVFHRLVFPVLILAVSLWFAAEILVALLQLLDGVDDVLFERHDLFEVVDVVGRAEPGLPPGVFGEQLGEADSDVLGSTVPWGCSAAGGQQGGPGDGGSGIGSGRAASMRWPWPPKTTRCTIAT
jgi:hypothetical protein